MKRLFFIPLLLISLSTCFVDIENAPCNSSFNCPNGQYCSMKDNRCHKTDFQIYSCEDSSCSENEFCSPIDNTCRLNDELGLKCNNHFDCPPGQFCNENMCIKPEEPQCAGDRDCLKDNVEIGICLEGTCRIEKCNLGFSDEDRDFANGCEKILPCSDDGLEPYGGCMGNNVCKCNSDCIIMQGFLGIDYDKGYCLQKCSPSDENKYFGNMLCFCTLNESGVCKRANLFETADLNGIVRAKMSDNCNNYNKDPASFNEITFNMGGEKSGYNRGTACKKTEDNKPVIEVTIFKNCGLIPCKDVITIIIPQNISKGDTIDTDRGGAIKATVKFSITDNNQISLQEIWFNAVSIAGKIKVEEYIDQVISLNLNLKMMRYDVPLCGDIIQKSCKDL